MRQAMVIGPSPPGTGVIKPATFSALWLVPGILCLVAFAWILTKIDSDFAGRAYAAYGGVYIAASLGWLC